MRGQKTSLNRTLTPEDEQRLRALVRKRKIAVDVHQRARAVLLLSEGKSITMISTYIGVSREHINRWLRRWDTRGWEGLMQGAHSRGSRHVRKATAAATMPCTRRAQAWSAV